MCIEIKPAPFRTPRAALALNVAPEPLPVTGGGRVEEQEKRILKQSRGWSRPQGLKGYSRDADYPDLYGYFDADDHSSPLNEVAESIFSAYPNEGLPHGGIRGPVLVLRLEPPRVTFHAETPLGSSGHESTHAAHYDKNIAFDELRDTIEMYEMQTAHQVARQRDMARMTSSPSAGLPPDLLAMMQAMMGGGMYMGPTGAHPFDFGA